MRVHDTREKGTQEPCRGYSCGVAGNPLSRMHTLGGITTQSLTDDMDANRIATHDAQTVTIDAAGNTTARLRYER